MGSIRLLLVLYVPSIALYFMNRRMLKTCIRRIHPYYDFEAKQLYVKRVYVPVSPMNEASGLLKE